MKANEFVKKHGWDDAKRLISHAFKFGDVCLVCNSCSGTNLTSLKTLVESYELVETLGGFERVKKAIGGKHIGYTHFYLHSNGRYVFLDHYVDFIPDHAQHIGMFNKAIADVESCQ